MEYVFDIECNGLNPDKIHCLVSQSEHGEYKSARRAYILREVNSWQEDDYLIGHNIIRYDIPVLERILDINIKAKLVDTLALSWYLFPERNRHGLADWGVEFGIPKPVIEDWDNLTPEEYLHRCKEDVRINTMLWEKQKAYLEELYGVNGYWDLVEYLTFKMQCARLQEENKWKLDEEKANLLLTELTEKQSEAFKSLEATLPKVEVFKTVTRPQKPFKQDRTLSAAGERWYKICEDNNIDPESTEKHKVLSGFKEPSAASPVQIKSWLFSLGWKPQTFKYVDDGRDENGKPKKRAIPQIKKDDDLCPSVVKLQQKHPDIKYLEDLGVIGHRKSLVEGLIKSCVDGYVKAEIQGLTNTLRFKHKVCVNIPSVRKQYGKEIRELLTARSELTELCGSDMDSLEDRTKQHFMMPHDPEYVEEMNTEGFDPHLSIAVEAGFITEEEEEFYKWYKHKS